MVGILVLIAYYLTRKNSSQKEYENYRSLLNFELTMLLILNILSLFPIEFSSLAKQITYGFLVIVLSLNVIRAYLGALPMYPMAINFFRPFHAAQKIFYDRFSKQ